MRSSEWERLKPLALPSYVVAALLVLIPVADTVLALTPLHPGAVAWRFGALGMGSQAVMTPLLGGLLALVTAAILGHRRGVRALQVLAVLAAVLLLAASVLFVLDAAQTRASIRATAKGVFDKASVVALVKYFIGVATSVAFALAGQRVIGRMGAHAASDSDTPPLVSSRADG
jgi:hypothetical protein